jgi:2-oxoisovalerate dehydrogenase E2 component (dihydrolipoyl transacylase)
MYMRDLTMGVFRELQPLVDIDIQEDINATVGEQLGKAEDASGTGEAVEVQQQQQQQQQPASGGFGSPNGSGQSLPSPARHRTLATPAVRRLTREHSVDISAIQGTGKDGRVLKEDVTRFVELRESGGEPAAKQSDAQPKQMPLGERKVPLTPVQAQMFKSMTKSLSIPHFLYSDEIHLDALIRLRVAINNSLGADSPVSKVSYMPFVIKAVSIALGNYPLLNSRLDLDDAGKPHLVIRPQHNIGVAMDTPVGLLVPTVKDVANLSILDIATELKRLQAAGAECKLAPADLRCGTITVSNIGTIGGTVVAPVVVTSEVAILGMGRARIVPEFDECGVVVPKTVVTFSWAADHRVVDGASMARMAALVRSLIEEPELMMARMK